ncbi:carboxypeptidase-like regulatory domain-containing protein [candidate division KSB1 bacterium]
MRKILSTLVSIFLILHLATSGTFGQTAIPRTTIITGTVTDASTGEPLNGTNVFIDNSLMGAATDQDGKFTINKVPQGTFQLVASFIGYKPVKKRVRLESDITYTIDFQLTPVVLQLEEVVVRYERPKRPKDWEKDLEIFQLGLLGSTKNANKCTILNLEVLSFDRDDETDIFRAAAERILKIENRALGYMVNVLLEEFEINDETIKMDYTIKFEEITPKNDRETENWEKAREETYHGSLQHFLASFAQGTYEKEGFAVDKYSREDGKRIKETDFNYDALISPGKNQFERILQFDGFLGVRNLDAGMKYSTTPSISTFYSKGFYQQEHYLVCKEESTIRLTRPLVPINIDGTLPAPYLILVSGFWGKARIADKLPFEYSPASK